MRTSTTLTRAVQPLPLVNRAKSPVIVDCRSDTVTKPSAGMRKAMAEAEVGDDVFGDDPTAKILEQKVASMANKEAGLFVPSGRSVQKKCSC